MMLTCNCNQYTENNNAEADAKLNGFASSYGSDTQGWVITGSAPVNVDCGRSGEKKEIQKSVAGTKNGITIYYITRTRIDCSK
jgi:hypothetical protein